MQSEYCLVNIHCALELHLGVFGKRKVGIGQVGFAQASPDQVEAGEILPPMLSPDRALAITSLRVSSAMFQSPK